jgi:hypothetical protein
MNLLSEAADLEAVKAAIDQLNRKDRAALRPWVLAVFDVDGKFAPPFHDKRAREEGRE